MSKWLDVDMLQEPFPMGRDASRRLRVGFNVVITMTETTTLAEEVVAVLVAASVGTYGSNIFISELADIPTGDGPYLTVNETGGFRGIRIHDQNRPAYPRPGVQIVVRANTYDSARTMARAAHNALAAVRNTVVTP